MRAMTGDGREVHDGLPEVVERKLDPVERYGVRLTLFGVAILLVAVPFGLLLGQVITDGPATAWDADIADGLHGMLVGRDSVVATLEAISFLGTSVFLVAVIGIPVAFLAYKERWHLLLFLVVTSLGAGVVNTTVKVLVARPRPELEDPISSASGYSFPSGHTMASTACYGALLFAFAALLDDRRRRPAIAATCILVGAIGFSRLALGVHYVTDVLGGFVLGLAWLLASVAAWEVWREDRGLRRTAPLEEGVEPEEARDLT